MTKRMRIQLNFSGGGAIDKEISYYGDSMTEIAANIERDENDLLEYMRTGNNKGVKSFCFGGFMFQKAGLITAQMSEPDF